MPGRVRTGLAIFATKESPFRREAQAESLDERRHVRWRARPFGDARHRAVRRVARHQPERRWTPGPLAYRRILEEAQVQERLPGHGLDQRLHHPSHSRRHSPGHDAKRQLATGYRCLPQVGQPFPLRCPPCG